MGSCHCKSANTLTSMACTAPNTSNHKLAYNFTMIVYSCHDLIFATKIRSTAEALQLPNRPARDSHALANRLNQVDDGKSNEPVTAVLIDLDLGDTALKLVEQAKNHNQILPVIVFGSHVETQLLDAAKQRGADFVMPRSSFTANLPDILQRFGSTQV